MAIHDSADLHHGIPRFVVRDHEAAGGKNVPGLQQLTLRPLTNEERLLSVLTN